mgnify:CR=1 FL=1|tara:strand:+ start:18341 stop:18520 length:180 start_codon:yes stop_codon:yes gene_type:complete
MDILESVIYISIIILFAVYLFKLNNDNTKWQLDKYDALYYYVCKFFKKQGYEVCKIDLL